MSSCGDGELNAAVGVVDLGGAASCRVVTPACLEVATIGVLGIDVDNPGIFGVQGIAAAEGVGVLELVGRGEGLQRQSWGLCCTSHEFLGPGVDAREEEAREDRVAKEGDEDVDGVDTIGSSSLSSNSTGKCVDSVMGTALRAASALSR